MSRPVDETEYEEIREDDEESEQVLQEQDAEDEAAKDEAAFELEMQRRHALGNTYDTDGHVEDNTTPGEGGEGVAEKAEEESQDEEERRRRKKKKKKKKSKRRRLDADDDEEGGEAEEEEEEEKEVDEEEEGGQRKKKKKKKKRRQDVEGEVEETPAVSKEEGDEETAPIVVDDDEEEETEIRKSGKKKKKRRVLADEEDDEDDAETPQPPKKRQRRPSSEDVTAVELEEEVVEEPGSPKSTADGEKAAPRVTKTLITPVSSSKPPKEKQPHEFEEDAEMMDEKEALAALLAAEDLVREKAAEEQRLAQERLPVLHMATVADFCFEVKDISAMVDAVKALKQLTKQFTFHLIPKQPDDGPSPIPIYPGLMTNFPGPDTSGPVDLKQFEGLAAEFMIAQTHIASIQVPGMVYVPYSEKKQQWPSPEDLQCTIHLAPLAGVLKSMRPTQTLQILGFIGGADIMLAVVTPGRREPDRLLQMMTSSQVIACQDPFPPVPRLSNILFMSRVEFKNALTAVYDNDGMDIRLILYSHIRGDGVETIYVVFQCLAELYEEIVYVVRSQFRRETDNRLVVYALAKNTAAATDAGVEACLKKTGSAQKAGSTTVAKTSQASKAKKSKKAKIPVVDPRQTKLNFRVVEAKQSTFPSLADMTQLFTITLSVEDLLKIVSSLSSKQIALFFSQDEPILVSAALGDGKDPLAMINFGTGGVTVEDALENHKDEYLNFRKE